MAYFIIENFAAGLDLRRNALTAPPGTLRTLTNAHVTPGGEIEKRLSFEKIKDVDPLSDGLVTVNQKLYVLEPLGPGVTEPTDIWDIGVLKVQVPTIAEIVDWDLFDNKVFAVINTGSEIAHTFDGNLVPDATGIYCRTYKTKMFGVQGSVLSFSAVGAADDWTGTGAGSIDLSLEDSNMTDCLSMEVYYDKLAIFSSTSCQLWSIDPDPLKTQYQQTLVESGTLARHSVLQYGSGDVLYLQPNGVRSLRARNASLAAAVSDVGSPIDPVMQELYRTMGPDWMARAISILQPVTGRFWVILPDRIYILSEYPGPKITAWSEYIPTDADGNQFTIMHAVIYQRRVCVRDDQNRVFAFGGTDVTQGVYDACPVEVVFPFLDGGKPATKKKYIGVDAAAVGEWDVYVSYEPETEAEDYLGKITGPTFRGGSFPLTGDGTHISLRLRSAQPGPLLLSSFIIHYEMSKEV